MDKKSKSEYDKKYYQRNRERILARQKEYYQKNRKRIDKKTKQYQKANPKKRKKYLKNWYEKNKYIMWEKEKKKIQGIIYKLGRKCNKCGNGDIRVLEIHHIEGREKKRDWLRKNYDLKKIELLCANCHKIEHSLKIKNSSKKVVYITGTFDLFHDGHAHLFKQAVKRGNFVIVGLNVDEYVEKYKTPATIPYKRRKAVLAQNKYIDVIYPNTNTFSNFEVYKKYGPGIKLAGYEPRADSMIKKLQPKLDRYGVKIVTIKKIPHVSSSKIKHDIKNPKLSKQRVVYVTGTFDLGSHVGHIDNLEKAKKYGDFLVIGLNTDEYVCSYKGEMPVYPYWERAKILIKNRDVDAVHPRESHKDKRMYKKFGPGVRVVGKEFGKNYDREELAKVGVRVVVVPRASTSWGGKIKRYSTTRMKKRVRDRFLAKYVFDKTSNGESRLSLSKKLGWSRERVRQYEEKHKLRQRIVRKASGSVQEK